MSQLVKVKTLFGNNINDGTSYKATLLNPHGTTTANPVYLDQADADSLDAGTYTVAPQNKVIQIEIKNWASRNSLLRQLKTWCKRGNSGTLVVTFTDENWDYQINVKVLNLVQDDKIPWLFTLLLQTGDTDWRGVSLETIATWTPTGTGGTNNLTINGFDDTYLSVSMTPTAGPASGYLYQKLYQLPNTPGIEHGLIGYRMTVDTAALVAAGHMQIDCDDLRIINLRTGQELNRWIDNPNNANTGVWLNLNMKKGYALTLSTAVAISGLPAYLQFAINATTRAAMSTMEKTGITAHGNEWFYYTSVDAVNCRLYLGARGIYGTTQVAHAAATVWNWIQYPLLMKYGNTTATAPSASDANYDDTKPLILLTSTNNQWIWDATTKFYDPLFPNRTCGWIFSATTKGPKSKTYNFTQDAESGNPALGLKVQSYQIGALWKDELVTLSAMFTRAAYITTITMTGEKYRSNASWLLAQLRRFTSKAWAVVWTELTPTLASVWQAWAAHSGVALPANTSAVQLYFQGGYKGATISGDGAWAAFGALTCTLDFNSSNIPVGTFFAETNAYPMDLTLANNYNSDAFSVFTMMLLNKAYVMDGENKTVTYDGANAHSTMTLNDESRPNFIRVRGGVTNTMQISGTDIGTLNVVFSYYRRRV